MTTSAEKTNNRLPLNKKQVKSRKIQIFTIIATADIEPARLPLETF